MVLKANAYGLGAKRICRLLDSYADYFAVSCTDEFFEIRHLTSKPILILDPITDSSIVNKLINAGAELTISNFESFKVLKMLAIKSSLKIKVHIALNTGMNRFGFKNENDILNILSEIKKTQNISICGVFSHYFDAKSQKFSNLQFEKFLDFKKLIQNEIGENLIYHIASSDGICYQNGFDMVRAGMILYRDDLFDTIKLKSDIIDLQNLEKGEIAGYSAVFKANKKTKLAIVSIGYGDGVFRNIAGKGYVLINGEFSKIVAVCMDSIIVDVTNIKANIGDEVVLIGKSAGKQIFICDVAKWCDTISYEIIVRLTKRVKRKYIN